MAYLEKKTQTIYVILIQISLRRLRSAIYRDVNYSERIMKRILRSEWGTTRYENSLAENFRLMYKEEA